PRRDRCFAAANSGSRLRSASRELHKSCEPVVPAESLRVALPTSTLSRVCRSVQDFLSDGLDAADQSIQVTVGSPGSAPPPTNGDTHHRINLFFYRIAPFGFGTDGAPDQVGWIRLHCLITAFGVLEDKISGGENDL